MLRLCCWDFEPLLLLCPPVPCVNIYTPMVDIWQSIYIHAFITRLWISPYHHLERRYGILPCTNQDVCYFFSRTCVALHMRHHFQQMTMMLLINLDDTIKWRYGSFSDLLVWRIGLRKVRIFRSMVHYSTICPCLLDRWDRILYSYIYVMTLYYSTWICSSIVQQCEQSIHSISDSSSICDEVVWCFFQSSMRVSTVSQHVKTNFNYFQMISCWINIQHFILKLFELNINVHLCFNYIVLI